MFYKATGGSGRRKLSMILTDAEGYSLRALKSASNNGKNVLYVVPIQEKLSTEPLPYEAPEFCKMPKANCVSCGQKMPLQMLALHVEECSKAESEQDLEDDTEEFQVTDTEDSFGTCPICQTVIPTDLLPTHANFCIDRNSPRDATNNSPHQIEELPGPSSSVDSSVQAGANSNEWMKILDPGMASVLFCRTLLREQSQSKPLRFHLDLKDSPEDQERSILSFYKAKGVNWAAPLKCILEGDAAIGDGVNRHLLSLTIEKLRTGFSLNFGVADITLLFEGEQDHLVPCCSQTLLDSDLFVVAGRMICHSFLHGGPLLPGISPAIIHVLVGGAIETAEIHLKDCPDLDQRHTIQLVIVPFLRRKGRKSRDFLLCGIFLGFLKTTGNGSLTGCCNMLFCIGLNVK
uniref:UBZ4-type domain-containing protein n=1 Tax=Cyprinus carpio carpio TaxID=630221 RepID=A0A9J8BH17_CYPCA